MIGGDRSSMRAGLYARVSREEQAEGYSLDEQTAAMRRYCEQRGWQVAAEYVEPGVSGTTGDRPALRRALADCEARKLDVLLTHQLDRLARNLRLQLEILSDLGRWHVAYISVVEQIDYTTPQGSLFLSMLGAFNEYYVANLRRETRKGKLGRAKSGRSNASRAPFGYTREEDGDHVDSDRARVVLLAFEAYAAGVHSDVSLARLLNDSEGPRPARGRWTREAVRWLLSNPYYAGQVQYGGTTFPGIQPAIVSEELWQQVQALRARRGHGKGAGRQAVRVYPLARLAHCSRCGQRLFAQRVGPRRHSYRVYLCPASFRQVECDAGGRYVPADLLERQIGSIVGRLRLPADWRQRLDELAAEQPPDDTEVKRQSLAARLHRLREMYVEGDLERAEYDRRKAALQAELSALRQPETPSVLKAGEMIATLEAVWAGAPAEIRRDLLRTMLESVRVDVLARQVLSVRPYPQFRPLFTLAGFEEIDGEFDAEGTTPSS